MSVVTTADERLTKAKEDINSAIVNLSKIVIEQCWGYDSFNEEYKNKMKEAFLTLLKLRNDF